MEYISFDILKNNDEVVKIIDDIHSKMLKKHNLDPDKAVQEKKVFDQVDLPIFDIKKDFSQGEDKYSDLIKEIFSFNILLEESRNVENKDEITNSIEGIINILEYLKTNNIEKLEKVSESLSKLDFDNTNLSYSTFLGTKNGRTTLYTKSFSNELVKLNKTLIESTNKFITKQKNKLSKEAVKLKEELVNKDSLLNVKTKELETTNTLVKKTKQKLIKSTKLVNAQQDLLKEKENETEEQKIIITAQEKEISQFKKDYTELLIGKELINSTVKNIDSEGKIEKVLSSTAGELLLDAENREGIVLEFQKIINKMKVLIESVKGKIDEKKYRDEFEAVIKKGESIILAIRGGKVGVETAKEIVNWLSEVNTTFAKLSKSEKFFVLISIILSVGVTTAVVVGGGSAATKFIVDKFSPEKKKKYDSTKTMKTIKNMNKKLQLLKKEYNE